jgi:hypothetical protein
MEQNTISLLTPCYNEEANVLELYATLRHIRVVRSRVASLESGYPVVTLQAH